MGIPKGLQIGWALAAKRRNPLNDRICPVCAKTFKRRGLRKAGCKSVCCSRKCAGVLRKSLLIEGFNVKPRSGQIKSCPTCGKDFQRPPSVNLKHCSWECSMRNRTWDHISGANHYNWKGGLVSENIRLRQSKEAKSWRFSVFSRDGFQCKSCGKTGKGLQAHHIHSWADNPEIRFTPSNGVTLCKKCHELLHFYLKAINRVMNLVKAPESSHWYTKTGEPMHFVNGKTTGKPRPTTIADARELGLVPSVTNIINSTLRKPALEEWKTTQACLSVLTAPRKDGEELDAFVQRVLHDERQQDQEAKTAADLGTRIHKALEDELSGRIAEHEMLPWIEPVWEWLNKAGCDRTNTELVLVGDGYAGRTDLIISKKDEEWIIDFKTTRRLPTKGAYYEHKLQRAAYAKASLAPDNIKRTMNIYISTSEPGKFVVDSDKDQYEWLRCYKAFEHILRYWQLANNFP